MNELLKEYRERFEEFFPTEEFDGNLEEAIKECLEKNKKVHELYPLDNNFIY